MAAVPGDFVSTTFVDPEQLNSNKIWTRILQVLNNLFAWARTVKIPTYGQVFSTTDAGGKFVITHGLGSTPTAISLTLRDVAMEVNIVNSSVNSTTFQIFIYNGSGAAFASSAFRVDWVAWP